MWSAKWEWRIHCQFRTEPNFVILILNFCTKAKLENLAVNVNATHERLQPLFALHIGVVIAFRFCLSLLFCL
jgi:hypothetical protein